MTISDPTNPSTLSCTIQCHGPRWWPSVIAWFQHKPLSQGNSETGREVSHWLCYGRSEITYGSIFFFSWSKTNFLKTYKTKLVLVTSLKKMPFQILSPRTSVTIVLYLRARNSEGKLWDMSSHYLIQRKLTWLVSASC